MSTQNARRSVHSVLSAFTMLACAALLLTCGGGGGSGSGSSQTGSLSFKLVLPETQSQGLTRQVSQAEFPCVSEGITTIDAEVLDESNNLLADGGPFQCEAGEGSVNGVPAGNNRVLVVDANDEEGVTLFQGQAQNLTIVGGQTTDAGTITLEPVNRPPVLDPIGTQNVSEGQSLEIALTATDPDGDLLSFTTGNQPTGSNFTDNHDDTATFTWTPGFNASGNYSVIFTVTDDGTPPQSDTETVTITVGNVNQPPVFTPAIGDKSVDEGQLLQFTITGSDPDLGDHLTFSTSTPLPTGATFDPLTQTFSWTPDFGDAGNYTVRFTVTDDGSPQESAFEDVTITVGNVNRPPVLTPIGSQIINEGQLLHFTITGSDPDLGDHLTFSTSTPLPTGAAFDPLTQTFSWTPGFDAAGNYTVRFTVTDDGSPQESAFEDVTITVGNVNRPPVLTLVGCTIDGESTDIPVSMFEEQILQCTLSAMDPDASDTLTFSFTGDLPGTPSIGQVGSTATFTWTAPYLSASETPYAVTLVVEDNGSPSTATDSEPLEINVLFGPG